jgi:signal transduction histidine kinase
VWEGRLVRLVGLRPILVLAAGFGLGVASLWIARDEPGGSLAGDSVTGNLALLGAGWALVACGTAASARRRASRFGLLLTMAGIAWFLVEFANPDIGAGVVFTIGLATYAACPALVAHAALAYPGGRLTSAAERCAVGAAYAGSLVVLGVAPALFFDPSRQGCAECPSNYLAMANAPGAVDAVQRAGLWLGIAWPVVVVAVAALRMARSSPAARRVTAPVLIALVAYLALVVADYAHGLARGFTSNDRVDKELWIGQAAALVALTVGVATAWAREWRARTTIARITVELGEAPPSGGLRDVLARALVDPALQLAYRLDDGRYVDARGGAVSLREGNGRAVTPLERGGRCVVVLVHRADLLDDPGLVEEVGAAAGLALNHERLQAEARAHLEDLRASRARTVEAGDAERRRLERDLHDGAQQRLVVLSFALRLLRSELDGARAARVDAAEAELQAALSELHDLARGIYPAVLESEGLAAGIEALAEAGDVPITVASLPRERLTPAVEAAAYFLVAEVVKRSQITSVTIEAKRSDGRLCVHIDGVGRLDDELVDLRDRMGALDGELTVARGEPGRVAIRAEVPCES